MKKKLLAISGGPDSMYLLHKYRHQKVVVAHVNYHKRVDSNNDQSIVEEFCKRYDIPFFVYEVTEKAEGNFQNWARDLRYNFFKQIYLEQDCDELVVAHHKDDFLETAIMQSDSNREPRQFGIMKKSKMNGMNIYRPYINLLWKDEIQEKLDKKEIKYAIDSSNADPVYSRNKIRIDLSKKSVDEKQHILSWYLKKNRDLKKKYLEIDKEFEAWAKTDFDKNFFKNISSNKKEIVFKYITSQIENVKLSSSKMNSIIDFIESKDGGKKYIINTHFFLIKEKTKIFLKKF